MASVIQVISNKASSSSVSATINVSAGNTILAFLLVGHNSASYTSSVSDSGGNVYTKHREVTNGTAFRVSTFSTKATSGGSINVTGSYGISSDLILVLMEIAGADDFDFAGGDTNLTTSPSITTTSDGLIVAVFGNKDSFNAHTYTVGSGYTQAFNGTQNKVYGIVEYKTSSAAGSYNATVSMTGSTTFADGANTIIAFKGGLSGSASLIGTGTMTATGHVNSTYTSSANIVGNGSLTASGNYVTQSPANLIGSGVITEAVGINIVGNPAAPISGSFLYVTDINGNTEALSGYKLLKRFRKVNGDKTLAFLLLPTDQNTHSFPMVQEESIVEFKGESYRIKQVIEKNKGQTFYKEVVATHTLFDIIDGYIYETKTGPTSLQAALEFVFTGTSFTWSIVDSFSAQILSEWGKDNRLELFQDLLIMYGAEFTVSGTHLTFKKKIGVDSDFQFRYNYNVKTITRDVNTNNLSTYIRGYGKKNDDGTYAVQTEYTSPNSSIFGIRHAKPIDDERYENVTDLHARIKSEIKDTPDVSITIDFVDLRRAGYPFDVPGEGDNVFLIYEPMNIDLEARIMEITEEFMEFSDYPSKTTVTLANYRKKVSDKIVDFDRTQKQVDRVVAPDGTVRYNALDEAVKRATAALQSAQTELEFENGIIARSKINPNHLVVLNSAGVGISTDGGNTFSDAITYLGVNTSVLTAGQINANNISVMGGTAAKHTLIDANGLTVKGGAISIERPDGYKSVMDGIVRNGFNVQGSVPTFKTTGIEESGEWYRSRTTNRFENVQRFVFKHDSRYLHIIGSMYSDTVAGGNMAFDIFEESNGTVGVANAVVTETRQFIDQGYRKEVQIDLGVPTGKILVLYWRLYTNLADYYVYGNIRYLVQEG